MVTAGLKLLRSRHAMDTIVPHSGFSVWLTVLASVTMSFLAVFALALSVTTAQLAMRWSESLARNTTVRILAPAGQQRLQTERALEILRATPGVASAQAISPEDLQTLLTPWLGPDTPIDTLPVPTLIDVIETPNGYDTEGLRLRLAAEIPSAVLDDHERWRRPLVDAANHLQRLGILSLGLIFLTTAIIVSLAAQSALSANVQVIHVLRLIGARDLYIVRAFVRRFTRRAFWGALVGALFGMAAVALIPEAADTQGFLTGLGFQGWTWLIPLFLAPISGAIAYLATRLAAFHSLKGMA